jgi:hypothetical protein
MNLGIVDRIKSDTEFAQGVVRFALGTVVIIYLLLVGVDPSFPAAQYFLDNIVSCLSVIYGAALAIATWTFLRPGTYPIRRLLGTFFDYGMLGSFMMTGGEAVYPLFAAIVWVAVGNGIRFGKQALINALIIAVFTLVFVWQFSPYWNSRPYLVITLIITVVIIPIYAFSLLSQVRLATQAVATANFKKSQFLAQASQPGLQKPA